MNKRKPYFIIIAALCFASIISLFLPYLHLPEQEGVGEGYVIDAEMVALESNIISNVAKSEGIPRNVVYNAARNIMNGRDRETIESRLREEEYHIIDILSEQMNQKVAEIESVGELEERSLSYFGLIKLSASIMTVFKQDIISAFGCFYSDNNSGFIIIYRSL